MDPSKRMGRPAADYHSRGIDPAWVPQARAQREADAFYRAPGQQVPNNTMVGRQVQAELAQDSKQVYSNPYGDGRGRGIRGTGVDYQVDKPEWQQQRMMAPTPEISNQQMDLLLADRMAAQKLPSPLDRPPPPEVMTPGLAAQVQRFPGSGQPIGQPLPVGLPPQLEDLRSAVPVLEGSRADALFPDAAAGGFDLSKGKPARMPKPRS